MGSTMQANEWPQYQYRATLVRVVDGDTAVLDVDLGFDVHIRPKVRFMGYNAPELHGAHKDAAQAARSTLEGLLAGRSLLIRTHKDEQTFERYLAAVFVDSGRAAPIDVAAAMVAAGFNVPQGQ
jgi:micrococcal nuclease